jgi:hypothetical protein
MSNQNIADISQFENLQNQTDKLTGCQSDMTVFNASFKVIDKTLHDSDYDKRRGTIL